MRDWFFAACNPGLPHEIWGYLLPRVLEIVAAGEDPSNHGLEVSLSRFRTGDRSNWSARQWAVLDRFQRQFLDTYVRTADENLDDALCMFGTAGWPLDDLFAQIGALPDEILAQRLWHDWCRHGQSSIWLTAFWDQGGNARAFAFYTSRPLHDRMVDLGLAEATPPELADRALAVADVIWANADWSGPQHTPRPT